jgi:Flp pilus assembly protein TadG
MAIARSQSERREPMPRRAVVRRRARWSARRGSATLELAILLPLLLSVALLCVDFGRFAHFYIGVTNAARTGAGFASSNLYTPTTQSLWNAKVQQAVRDELSTNAWFDPSKATISQQMIPETGGYWRAQVDVTYPFRTLINWPFLPGYNTPVMLHRKVVMRGTL